MRVVEVEPWMQEAGRQLAYTARLLKKPICAKCNTHILSEECLDLDKLGLSGWYLCERCMKALTVYTDDLIED